MDELALRCEQQLEKFRIKELKDVLSRVGAAKQGKKQVLRDKIMAIILNSDMHQHGPKGPKPESSSNRHVVSRQDVAKVIDDIYRKMCGSGADLATVGRHMPVPLNSLISSDEQDEALNQAEAKTRCPCGSSMDSGTMIQCDDPSCMVWQHVNCVIIPEKEGMEPECPPQFYCEICRIQHGDPFCVAAAHPLLPIKLITSSAESEGSSPLQNVETPFTLTHSDQELLRAPNYDLQIWCVLLNDKVPFRMHWPLFADLQVNGVPVRVTNRPGQQLLGINGRDDGPGISNYTREGMNRISLSSKDGRSFCVGIRIIHRLTVEQVLIRIPKEAQGENLDTCLARIRRCIGGGRSKGTGVGNDDNSDSDLEVVSEWVTVNLRCPMSGSRMKVAGRFKPCVHMGCFDVHTFVEINQRARKWQCPICLKNYSLRDLIIDPFFTRITKAMKSYGEDVTEVEMKPDGCWRPKLEGDAKLRELWRSPDGSINLANGEKKSRSYQGLKTVKVEEGTSAERVPLKIGIKRTRDGKWQVNGSLGLTVLESNDVPGRDQVLHHRETSRISSATASIDEDPSVNQDPSERFNHCKMDEVEINSASVELQENAWLSDSLGRDAEHLRTSEVIVLSDTEEENTDEYNSGAGNGGGLVTLPSPVPMAEQPHGNLRAVTLSSAKAVAHHNGLETALPYSELGSFRDNTNEPLDLFGTNTGDLATPFEHDNFWSSEVHSAPLELLDSVPDASREAPRRHRPACPTPSYVLSSKQHRANSMLDTSFLNCNRQIQNFVGPEYRDEAVESVGVLNSTDQSLRLFLPHQPARASVQPIVEDPLMVCREGLKDRWFSLSLGGGESVTVSPPNAVAIPCNIEHASQDRRRADSIVNSASVLLDMSNHGTRATAGDINTPARRRPANTSVHRSAHCSRNYFRVDSDSD